MNKNTLLSIQELRCERGDDILFEHLNLDVNAGELCQISGPNGSGKTTLLRTVAGFTLPYAGKVSWQNNMASLDNSEFMSAIRYIGHSNALKSALSATENLDFLSCLYGGNSDEKDIKDALDYFSLGAIASAPLEQLSEGQKRKASLARLMLGSSKLWVLDEPFTSLDHDACSALEKLIERHLKNNGCILIATHQSFQHLKTDSKLLNLEDYRA